MLKGQQRVLQAQLASALHHIDRATATVTLRDQEVLEVRVERDGLKEEVDRLGSLILDLERSRIHLSYDDLRPGGVLAKAMKEFTFFPDFECNDAFLELINFTDGCEPGEGLCEKFV